MNDSLTTSTANTVSIAQLLHRINSASMFLLVTGFLSIQAWNQSPTTNIAIIIWLIGLIRLVSERKAPPLGAKHNAVILAGLAVFICATVSWYFSPYAPLPMKKLEPDLRFILFGLTSVAIFRSNFSKQQLTIALSIASLSYGASAFNEIILNGLNRANGDENAVTFGNGAFLIFSLTLASGLLSSNGGTKLFAVFCSLAAFYAAFASGTRGSFIALLPLLLFLFWEQRRLFNIKHYLSSGIVAVILLSAMGYIADDRINATLMELKKTSSGNTANSTGQRLELWKVSSCIFSEYPILGTGPRVLDQAILDYKDQCNVRMENDRGTYSQAHSVYFNTLATKGLTGILSLALFIVCVIRLANSTNHEKKILIYVFLICAMSYGLTIDLFFKNFIIDRHLVLLAILCSLQEKQ